MFDQPAGPESILAQDSFSTFSRKLGIIAKRVESDNGEDSLTPIPEHTMVPGIIKEKLELYLTRHGLVAADIPWVLGTFSICKGLTTVGFIGAGIRFRPLSHLIRRHFPTLRERVRLSHLRRRSSSSARRRPGPTVVCHQFVRASLSRAPLLSTISTSGTATCHSSRSCVASPRPSRIGSSVPTPRPCGRCVRRSRRVTSRAWSVL